MSGVHYVAEINAYYNSDDRLPGKGYNNGNPIKIPKIKIPKIIIPKSKHRISKYRKS